MVICKPPSRQFCNFNIEYLYILSSNHGQSREILQFNIYLKWRARTDKSLPLIRILVQAHLFSQKLRIQSPALYKYSMKRKLCWGISAVGKISELPKIWGGRVHLQVDAVKVMTWDSLMQGQSHHLILFTVEDKTTDQLQEMLPSPQHISAMTTPRKKLNGLLWNVIAIHCDYYAHVITVMRQFIQT